ncbi:hypothetical protein EDD11_009162 [Mortierella claussenii]|nr:hypothetical protein EDD11_009162 [Mortierella claussenii]
MPTARNPFDVPEIRTRLSHFVDVQDSVACSQVCKNWKSDFTGKVWHTIDLEKQPRIKELSPKVVARHGHYIRFIRSVKKRSELDMFDDANINHLEEFSVKLKCKSGYQQQVVEIVQRNMQTLTKLEVGGDSTQEEPTKFELKDLLVPKEQGTGTHPTPVKLTHLVLRHLLMTREEFSQILEGCPNLNIMEIIASTFLDPPSEPATINTTATDAEAEPAPEEGAAPEQEGGEQPPPQQAEGEQPAEGQQEAVVVVEQEKPMAQPAVFRHPKITHLTASVEQVFEPRTTGENGTKPDPLLIHFPNLTSWEVSSSKNELNDPTPVQIKAKIQEYCPHLKKLYVNDTAASIQNSLLVQGSPPLTSICILYSALSPSVIYGLLVHKSTLTTLRSFKPTGSNWSYHRDIIWDERDLFEHGWMIHLVLSSCPRLTIVDLPYHEVDLERMDHFPWVCTDLKELRVRFKGLDTQDLIMAVINKWRRGVIERRSKAAGLAIEEVKVDDEVKPEDVKSEYEKTDIDKTREAKEAAVEGLAISAVAVEANIEATTAPAADGQSSSSIHGTTSPAVEEQSTPVTQEAATSAVHGTATPATEAQVATAVEEQATPGADAVQAAPAVEEVQAAEVAAGDQAETIANTEAATANTTTPPTTTATEGTAPAQTDVDNPLVDKVVKHLLQFEQLRTVWVGYKVWTV